MMINCFIFNCAKLLIFLENTKKKQEKLQSRRYILVFLANALGLALYNNIIIKVRATIRKGRKGIFLCQCFDMSAEFCIFALNNMNVWQERRNHYHSWKELR